MTPAFGGFVRRIIEQLSWFSFFLFFSIPWGWTQTLSFQPSGQVNQANQD